MNSVHSEERKPVRSLLLYTRACFFFFSPLHLHQPSLTRSSSRLDIKSLEGGGLSVISLHLPICCTPSREVLPRSWEAYSISWSSDLQTKSLALSSGGAWHVLICSRALSSLLMVFQTRTSEQSSLCTMHVITLLLYLCGIPGHCGSPASACRPQK